jgi:RNA polymerase sigma-B factor
MTVTATPRRSPAAERRQAETNRPLAEAHTAGPAERRRLVDEVIVANLEVARSIAGRYRNRGIATEDLEQVAFVRLAQAANRFDPSKADDLLSYAVPTIRGEVRRHFRDLGWVVRPPRGVQELQSALNTDVADSSVRVGTASGHGEVPEGPEHPEDSNDAVAARLDVTIEQVREARSARGCFQPTSLDALLGANREPLAASLVDDEFDEHAVVEARVILRTLTHELSPRDRLILYLRFVEGRTQAEIGKEIGVPQMQVSRLLDRILLQMRTRALGSSRSGTGNALAS